MNRFFRLLLAVAGFASTSWGAVQADRLSVDGADAGPWQWAAVAGLFGLSAAGAAGRTALRVGETAARATGPAESIAQPLRAIGVEASRSIARGDLASAELMLDAARKLKGAP